MAGVSDFPRGNIAIAFGNTLVPFALGLGAALLLTFAFGLPAEEGLVSSLLLDVGVAEDRVFAIVDGLDWLGRVSVATLFLLAALAALGWCLATTAADRSTTIALVEAAAAEASTDEVPPPSQVVRVIRGTAVIERALLVVICAGTVAFVIGFGVGIAGGYTTETLVCLAGLAAMGGLIALYRYLRRVVRPRRAKLRRRIAEHWTTSAERAAWNRAPRQAGPKPRGHRGQRDRAVQLSDRLNGLGAGALGLAIVSFYVVTFILYPDASRITRELGERAEVSDSAEQMAMGAVVVMAVMLLLAAALPGIALPLHAHGCAAERKRLREALEDSQADRPAAAVLTYHSRRHGAPMAHVLAAAAGVGLAFGPAALILGFFDGDSGFYAGAADLFAPYRPLSVVIIAIAVVLVISALLLNGRAGAAEIGMRNALLWRWPTRPEVSTSDDDSEDKQPALIGPALTPSDDT